MNMRLAQSIFQPRTPPNLNCFRSARRAPMPNKPLECGARLLKPDGSASPTRNPKRRFINALPRASLTTSRFTVLDLTHVRSGLWASRQNASTRLKIGSPYRPRRDTDSQQVPLAQVGCSPAKMVSTKHIPTLRSDRPLSLYCSSGGGERSNTSPFGRSSTSSA
jgi:hypothetical protein